MLENLNKNYDFKEKYTKYAKLNNLYGSIVFLQMKRMKLKITNKLMTIHNTIYLKNLKNNTKKESFAFVQ